MSASHYKNVASNDGSRSLSVRITAEYHEYSPPFPVEPIIRRMLDSVPSQYLNGLGEVVLTDTTDMSRKRRRGVTQSRKRKVRVLDAGGLYHPGWNNEPAWIEIFVDNTLRGWERSLWLSLPFMREGGLGEVLFHELGHHIHFTARPEYREREDVADAWKARLNRNYNRSRHQWFRAITSPFRPLIFAFSKLIYRNALRKGMISRSEFEELTNPSTNKL